MYIIEDWVYNIMFNGKMFNTFDDAWCFVYENIEDKDNAYDDIFVVRK